MTMSLLVLVDCAVSPYCVGSVVLDYNRANGDVLTATVEHSDATTTTTSRTVRVGHK